MTSSIPAFGNADLPLTADGRVDGRSARKVQTRRRIMNAASELFAEKGYGGTSIDEIAEAAGVSKGTIFYNFKNKADLFEQLLRWAGTVVNQAMRDSAQDKQGWDALSAVVWSLMQSVQAAPAYAKIVVNELFTDDRPWAAALPELRTDLTQPLLDALEELAVEREQKLGHRLLQKEQGSTIAMALVGAAVLSTLDASIYHPERPLDQVHNLMLHSISAVRP